jgi:hypothetical protein
MILSNFWPLGTVGEGLDKIYLAEAVVTTGWFLWRKSEVRKVFRRVGEFWHFADTGKYTPSFQCERLEDAHCGKRALWALAQLQSSNHVTTQS